MQFTAEMMRLQKLYSTVLYLIFFGLQDIHIHLIICVACGVNLSHSSIFCLNKRPFSSTPIRFEKKLGIIEPKGATHKKFDDTFCKHTNIIGLYEKDTKDPDLFIPYISDGAFIAPDSTIVGGVAVNHHSSVWYGCVIRSQKTRISIGAFTSILENTVIMESSKINENHDGSTKIGSFVIIGNGCILKSCSIEDECLVGMGSILEEGSHMEHRSVLGAGSVLTKNARIPTGEVWVGNPAKLHRKLSVAEMDDLSILAEDYSEVGDNHRFEFSLPSRLGILAEKAKIFSS